MPFTDFASILDRSRATDALKRDLDDFASHRAAARVEVVRHAPRIKVLRAVAHLLDAEPDLAIDRVRVDAASGCSDFRGTLTAELEDGAARSFDFVWDCQWRAIQQGWVDGFGLPDQIRAARTFEWRCFAEWRERRPSASEPVEAAAGSH
jgi:hypothetical protein